MRKLLLPKIVSLKDNRRQLIAYATLVFILACSDVKFENGPNVSAGPDNNTICSPIGGPFISNEYGMYGDIYVQNPNHCQPAPHSACDNHEKMIGTGTRIQDVVVSAPLVPTRYFTDGFETRSGGLLSYPAGFDNLTGQPIVEFWGLKVRTQIALADGDAPGNYQLGVLADDGFRLTREDTGEVLLNIYGVTPTQLNVAPAIINLQPGDRIPVVIEYYQTPRYEIAMYMIWRHNPSNLHEPLNGHADGGSTWFPGNLNDLASRNWIPMRSQNFFMPNGFRHDCI